MRPEARSSEKRFIDCQADFCNDSAWSSERTEASVTENHFRVNLDGFVCENFRDTGRGSVCEVRKHPQLCSCPIYSPRWLRADFVLRFIFYRFSPPLSVPNSLFALLMFFWFSRPLLFDFRAEFRGLRLIARFAACKHQKSAEINSTEPEAVFLGCKAV